MYVKKGNVEKKKMKKIYRLEVLIFFGKMHDRIPFCLALRSSMQRFQMPLDGLSFVKTLVTSGISIYATFPVLQNMNMIDRLPPLIHLRYF